MKIHKILNLLFFIFSISIFAQKIGVVDTNYILDRLPQYKDAQQRLETQVKVWQEEVQKKQSEYEKKKEAFENEKVLLVGDQLKQRQTEIDNLEKELKKTIENRFGTNGEINKIRGTMSMPFQDQIWNAIKTVSEKNGLGIVLDKSNNISVLFLDKKFDYTDRVLDVLLKGGQNNNSKSGNIIDQAKDKVKKTINKVLPKSEN